MEFWCSATDSKKHCNNWKMICCDVTSSKSRAPTATFCVQITNVGKSWNHGIPVSTLSSCSSFSLEMALFLTLFALAGFAPKTTKHHNQLGNAQGLTTLTVGNVYLNTDFFSDSCHVSRDTWRRHVFIETSTEKRIMYEWKKSACRVTFTAVFNEGKVNVIWKVIRSTAELGLTTGQRVLCVLREDHSQWSVF